MIPEYIILKKKQPLNSNHFLFFSPDSPLIIINVLSVSVDLSFHISAMLSFIYYNIYKAYSCVHVIACTSTKILLMGAKKAKQGDMLNMEKTGHLPIA